MRDSNTLMRLRLMVRRHALPEVRVVFAVQLDNEPTIASLLEQVNEIVPLESNDWGLEDYAVELRDSSGHAFDCLHFQQVSSVLNNDEQVYIRPLDTGDRRKRRLSGRDQITTDGRHLIDGVPFGRPRLRSPRDRPPVDIPPLKRRRVTYDVEEDDREEPRFLLTEHGEDAGSNRRVRTRATIKDAEGDAFEGDQEDADDDFVDEDSDEDEGDEAIEDEIDRSDLEAELRGLQEDNEDLQDAPSTQPDVTHKNTQPTAPPSPAGLDLETLDKITALRAAFPTAPVDACERALAQHQGSTTMAYLELQTQHQPAMSFRAINADVSPNAPQATENDDAASDESEPESVGSVVKHYDKHGFPSGSILSGTAASQTAESMRRLGHSVKAPVHTKFDNDGAVPVERQPRPPSSDQYSSSGGSGGEGESESGGDAESDNGPEIASSKEAQASGRTRLFDKRGSSALSDSGDQSEGEDESGSDGSSEDEATSSDSDDSEDDDKSASDGSDGSSDNDDDGSFSDDTDDSHQGRGQEAGGSAESSASSDEADSSSDDESSNDSAEDAPQTRSVNAEAMTEIEPSPPKEKTVRVPELDTVSPEPKGDPGETSQPVPPGQGKRSTQKRNARRKAARMAQKAAAEDEAPSPASVPLPAAEMLELVESVAAKKAALLRRFGEMQELIPQEVREATSIDRDAESGPLNAPVPEKSTLMGDTQLSVHNQPPLDSADGHPEVSEDRPTEQADPEAWRTKIAYRAVECCQDGIEFSEPPFPFVQRWDPQQKYFHGDRNNGGRRSKRKQQSREELLEDGGQANTKRRKYGESMEYDGDGESYANETVGHGETLLNYDEEPLETQRQPEQTSLQPADVDDDLPPLPTDISTLPALGSGEVVTGMILTWKQWLLSKATNWQPQVSALTGVVVRVLDDETLEVRLAKRDQNIDRSEKVYDDDGHRVYDKFEAPDIDDENDELAEQGYRTLDLADMVEPRVLRLAPGAVGDVPSSKDLSGPHAMPDAIRHEVRLSEDRVSPTPDQTQAGPHERDSQNVDVDTQGGGGQSTISESPVAQGPAISISEDRRHEISLLINDADFRKDVDPSVTTFPDSAGLDLSSPSRQLEEMTHGAITIVSSQAAQSQSQASSQLPSQPASNNLDSQPIHLEPFHGFSDAILDSHDQQDERRVAYPALDLPPSETGSLHSGRQVDPDFSIELVTGDDPFHAIDDPALASRSTLGRHSDNEENPAVEKKWHDVDAGLESDSSSASLSDLWREASTNGSLKSPTKSAVVSAIKARKPDMTYDLEYEDTMRRLDGSDDISVEDDKEHLSKVAQELVDIPIEKPTPDKLSRKKGAGNWSTAPGIKTERASPSPHPGYRGASARTAQATNSPFPPKGSQVVSLVTSGPEPELEEHYAEDSVDGTYEDPDLPTGSGWVKKPRVRRGVSMPASSVQEEAAAPTRFASPQSRQSAESRLSSAMMGLEAAKKLKLGKLF
ncbi:hypothetical protein N658DRAFT_521049 [Parathielavia hyrcaniae]|uniref:DUF7357 domain-containing protein n=1 Tax=Parathielavia hyrcaniae TaxID=113614 RepID=A0AAN6Q9V2_9PEZI|nr:hypothetical protein N658DRAFT_521049 [Parathielavia hyrcaniae]